MNEEMIQAIKEANSAEELRAAAKENDIELTEEQAKEYFDRFHTSGELSDEELGAVAGGCRAYGHLTVTDGYCCEKWKKDQRIKLHTDFYEEYQSAKRCGSCEYEFYNKGLLQCEIQ